MKTRYIDILHCKSCGKDFPRGDTPRCCDNPQMIDTNKLLRETIIGDRIMRDIIQKSSHERAKQSMLLKDV